MRGSFLHNKILLDPPERYLRELGASVWREFPTGPGRDAGFVDLFAQYRSLRIAVEAETTSSARLVKDVAKAVTLNADVLFIIVPNRRVAKAAKIKLAAFLEDGASKSVTICCEPQGVAMTRLTNICSLMTALNVPQSLSHEFVGGEQ